MSGWFFPAGVSNQSLDGYQFSFEHLLEVRANRQNGDDTVSLTESVVDFEEENGRTYHAYSSGSYFYPNDEQERERLDLQYEILSTLFSGKLFFSPWSRKSYPLTVLDIATGTGQWAMDMADKFPESRVRGIDLSPIQPTWAPPNVEFLVEDATYPWQENVRYDFIYTRVTLGCWTDFAQEICRQAYEALNPGGWFESAELDPRIYCDDGTMPSDWPPHVWVEELNRISEIAARPVMFAQNLRQSYEEGGFRNVQEQTFRLPLND